MANECLDSFNERSNDAYDQFVSFVEECLETTNPLWIMARSVENAKAFACWCIENGIEEPEIVVFTNGN
jgi:hypothetical protein